MVASKTLALGGLIVLAACSLASQRRAAENANVQESATKEIRRICALLESERQIEIQKIKDEAGVIVACGKPRPHP